MRMTDVEFANGEETKFEGSHEPGVDSLIGNEEIRSTNWNIWRTNLMGEGLELVMGDLAYQPMHMQVDPYNG